MSWTQFTVRSKTDSTKKYLVKQFDDGEIICECPGYKWRSRCWHKDSVACGEVPPDEDQPGLPAPANEVIEPDDGDISFNVDQLEERP